MSLSSKAVLEKLSAKQTELYFRELLEKTLSGELTEQEAQSALAHLHNAHPEAHWQRSDFEVLKKLHVNTYTLRMLEGCAQLTETKATLSHAFREILKMCVFLIRFPEFASEELLERMEKDCEVLGVAGVRWYQALAVCEEEILRILSEEKAL